MAITTYSELQSAITNWLDRSDLSSRIVEFIALFEAKVNRRLRVRQMVTSTTLTPSSGSASLPGDYLEWIRVTWSGSIRRELEWVESTYLQASYPTTPSDTPRFFTIEGSTLKVRPVDDTGLDFVYYQKIPALSDEATTNWLLTAHPDLYLFGSLVESNAYSEDVQNGALWDARSKEVMDEIIRLSAATRGSARKRAYGATP